MSHCIGKPAEQWAEQYIAGTLPDPEAEAFEEHYFDCAICLAQLQALQAVAAQMRSDPVKMPRRVIRWPEVVGAIGAIAALLLITSVGYRHMAHKPDVAVNPGIANSGIANAGAASSAAQNMSPASPAASAVSELADLTLPPFQASSLRGAEEDPSYRAGMTAYESGDCAGAVDRLTRVSAQSADALSAQFYSGVCELKLNRLAAAATTLGRVADKDDSPQQEAALYYLAQVDLLRADGAGARKNLEKAISLHGEFEQRATGELKKLP